jgi:hypothetical protein
MSTAARRARLFGVAGTVLVIAAVVALIVAWRAQTSAPSPPPAAARYVPVTQTSFTSSPTTSTTPRSTAPGSASSRPAAPAPRTRGPILTRSVPLQLSIPAIHVTSMIQQLGIAADGSVQVPPLGRDSHAGWYKYSPTPGQLGPAILLGHIDSARYGPGVFYRLGDLRQRDRVSVTRSDGTVAVFEIERVVQYPKARFPTLQVYGNIDHAGLRLITCGGKFDPAQKSYEDNIVAYAALVSSHRG